MKKVDISNEDAAQRTLELFKLLKDITGEFVCRHDFRSELSRVVTLGAAAELLALCSSFSEDKKVLDVIFACIRERQTHYFKLIEAIDTSNVFCFKHRKKR